MNKLPIMFLAMALPLSTQAVAGDIDAEVTAGGDSNPFLFSDVYNPISAFFVDSKLNVKHRFDSGFGVKGSWKQRFYEGKVSDAGKRTFNVGVSYRNRGTLLGQDARYRASASYSDYDKTYTSRTLGLPGEVAGSSIADRYDASWFEGEAGIEFRLNKKFRLDISAKGRSRDYHDYTADLGITNLDYNQWSSRVKMTFKPSKGNQLEVSYRFRQRDFKDRLGKDLLGNLVAGTAMKQDYHIFEASFAHDITKTQEIEFFGYIENRSDNVSGYYDTTWKRAGAKYSNQIADNQKLEATITYRDYVYDNNDTLTSIEGEEPINSKKGFGYDLSYAHRLPLAGSMDWWVIARGSYEDYDSVNAFYIYKQTMVHAGLQIGF